MSVVALPSAPTTASEDATPAPIPYCLVNCTTGVAYPLLAGRNIVGRSPQPAEDISFINLESPRSAISRMHAVLLIAPNNDVWVYDAKSTNGTVIAIREGPGLSMEAERMYQAFPGTRFLFGDVELTLVVDDTVMAMGGAVEGGGGDAPPPFQQNSSSPCASSGRGSGGGAPRVLSDLPSVVRGRSGSLGRSSSQRGGGGSAHKSPSHVQRSQAERAKAVLQANAEEASAAMVAALLSADTTNNASIAGGGVTVTSAEMAAAAHLAQGNSLVDPLLQSSESDPQQLPQQQVTPHHPPPPAAAASNTHSTGKKSIPYLEPSQPTVNSNSSCSAKSPPPPTAHQPPLTSSSVTTAATVVGTVLSNAALEHPQKSNQQGGAGRLLLFDEEEENDVVQQQAVIKEPIVAAPTNSKKKVTTTAKSKRQQEEPQQQRAAERSGLEDSDIAVSIVPKSTTNQQKETRSRKRQHEEDDGDSDQPTTTSATTETTTEPPRRKGKKDLSSAPATPAPAATPSSSTTAASASLVNKSNKPSPLRAVATGFDSKEKDTLVKLLKARGGALVDDLASSDLLLVKDPPQCTPKFLIAIGTAVPVVTARFLEEGATLEAAAAYMPDLLRNGTRFTAKKLIAVQEALRRKAAAAAGSRKMLHGKTYYLGDSLGSSKATVLDVVTSCGGSVSRKKTGDEVTVLTDSDAFFHDLLTGNL